MLLNYLKVAYRNIIRNRLFAAVNIFGISVSLACCIILFYYGTRELGYDKHHGRNVYRLVSKMGLSDGKSLDVATNSLPIAGAFYREIPEVELAMRATTSSLLGNENTIRFKDGSWNFENGYIADSTFFDVLTYDIIMGNKDRPLTHHNAIVFEKEWAGIIFGTDDPLGKIVKLSGLFGDADFEVTAVYDKNSYDSHLNPSFVVSMANNQWNDFFNRGMANWIGNNMVYTYLKLHPAANLEEVDKKMYAILTKNGGKIMKEMGITKKLSLQPVTQIHTSEGFFANVPDTVNARFVKVLLLIGIIILVLACVNYINLSTAQSGKRALEVGVRKVMGVSSRGLIGQFLGESFLIIFISLIFSLLFAQLALPYFNQLIDRPVEFSPDQYPLLIKFFGGFLLFTGLIAGFYPAFYLSSFNSIEVLKGKGRDRKGASLIRKGLVVFQFMISIGLLSAIIIISKQVNFIKNKELGFESNSKLVIPLNTREASDQYDVLKNMYSNSSMVRQVSGADGIPGSPIINDILVYKKGQTMDDAIHIYNNTIDLEYIDLLGMDILSGRNFQDYNKDTTKAKVLISETGINMLGIPMEEAPGETLFFEFEGMSNQYEIVGVVNDIHQFSLHNVIDPMMYTIGNGDRYQNMVLDVHMEDFQSLISSLEKDWENVIPETPFSYLMLDEHLMQQYEADFNTFNLIKYFTLISIVISVLGLYAMSMFLAESRFKEIGIRKTFGAGIGNIIMMVSIDLSKLIVIAYIISIPISIFAMNKWLDTFAYKISQGVDIYILAGVISILIGWLTISYQSIRAARTNPVDVLREE